MKKAIRIDERDNVATVTSDVELGETIEAISHEGEIIGEYRVSGAVPFGHKIALTDLKEGDQMIKYGEVIGAASKPVGAGEWVHTHNVESATVPTSAFREGSQ